MIYYYLLHNLHEWRAIVAALGVAISLVTSVHAIIRRREPRAALWWAALSWMVPFVGPALYYLLGINRIQRKASRLMRRQPTLPRPSPRPLLSRSTDANRVSPRMRHLRSLANVVDVAVGKPLVEGNAITPLVDGDATYPEMLKAIDEAKETIALATYIFNNDRAGRLFIDALARAKARNVEVRVLIDDVGSGFSWSSVHHALQHAKVPVAYFMPTLVPWRMAYVNMRNHRKLLVVDGRVGFTGGMNIHEGHLRTLHPRFPTQDTHFKVEGPVVAHLQEAFREDWYFTTGEVLPGKGWFPPLAEAGKVVARGIADGPDEDFEKCRWTLLGALANAKSTVRIVTPYFVPDSSMITALNLAAMSGVAVDIVLPSVSDLRFVQWASAAILWQVLERGCRVWLTPPPFDHTKLMVIDGGWALFGSSNWDARSLRLNFEFNVECYDENLAARLDAHIDGKIQNARRISLADIDARPLPRKLRDGLARLWAPHL